MPMRPNHHQARKQGTPARTNACVSTMRRLLREKRAVSVVEFALMLPIFVTLGMYGTEIAYMSTVNMQISQMALSVADNASRLGQLDNGVIDPTINETDVDAVMFGALKQGEALNFEQNGRVILSSLELDSLTGRQFIHWQRCRGDLVKISRYGDDSSTHNGLTGTPITGVGQPGFPVTASANNPVMVAEVYYNYHGLFGTMFTKDQLFRQEAVMMVRDNRDLQNYHASPSQDGLTGSTTVSSCS